MFHREFFLLGRRLAVTGSAWLKTQSVIFLMTSSLSMLGLLLIGNPYYILGGIGIGVLDALPIFGTGTALVPWSILLLFKREWGHALILFGLYLLCYFLREFTEAHLMGKKMGLSPLETLAAKSTGTVLFVAITAKPAGQLFTLDGFPALVSSAITGLTQNSIAVMILIFLLLCVIRPKDRAMTIKTTKNRGLIPTDTAVGRRMGMKI